MPSSRRSLFRSAGITALAGAAAPLVNFPASSWLVDAISPTSPIPSPVFLDHNENAYGPSESVLAILRDSATRSNRYARSEYDDLVAKLAALHSVKPEQILLGSGSSEILRMAAYTLLDSGKKLIQAAPTYPALGHFAEGNGAQVIGVPITKMYEHDLHAMLVRADKSTSLVYICNPNNPTGTLTPRADLEAFIRKLPANTIVLIDEAYHHFVSPNASYVSFLDRPLDDPRVMVCRTFSKVYG